MAKRDLSESDICAKFITPALIGAGWDELTQLRREISFTKGQIKVRGKMVTRGEGKRADYILYFKPNMPLAVIEAKDNKHSVGDGMQQALDYAEFLQVPFVFSSNGDGFVFHDSTGLGDELEATLPIDKFPSPQMLWARYCQWKGITPEAEPLVLQDYFDDASGRYPHYYQMNAVNAAVEAVAKGRDRLLLVMATGTGKTYTAFQIIWRLWKAGHKKRILYLADRNLLIDQTMVNDFRPFGGVMAKLSTRNKTIGPDEGPELNINLAIDKHRRIDTAFEVYMSLYQAITGPEERQKLFKEFSPVFFDLIVIDECHRGSADEESAWREILDYFSSATQIGMTATPKETEFVSNIHYFGDPIYTYSLKQGILDGFLAPFKVIRSHIDLDVGGYRPEPGKRDIEGQEIEDRVYNPRDFERTLVIDDRTKLVAERISEFLRESGDRFQKSIIFCVDQEHAARMRQALINANKDLATNPRYVMRITGGAPEGQAQLGNFTDPESIYPVLVTTSRLLSTGIDVQTCKLIVIDKQIESMGEFKQIIGRGTRVREDAHKFYFTILDFRGASNHFADPDFDGPPIEIYVPPSGGPMVPPDDTEPPEPEPGEIIVSEPPPYYSAEKGVGGRPKIYINGVPAQIIHETIQYVDHDGKLITETLRDYSKRTITEHFVSLSSFLQRWSSSERKQAIVEELSAECIPLEILADEVGKDLDPFDLVCYVAFGQPPLTRKERADNVRKRDVFAKYGSQARAVLEALLRKYQDDGIVDLSDVRILQIPPLDQMGTLVQLIKGFGSRDQFEHAVHEMQAALYEAA